MGAIMESAIILNPQGQEEAKAILLKRMGIEPPEEYSYKLLPLNLAQHSDNTANPGSRARLSGSNSAYVNFSLSAQRRAGRTGRLTCGKAI